MIKVYLILGIAIVVYAVMSYFDAAKDLWLVQKILSKILRRTVSIKKGLGIAIYMCCDITAFVVYMTIMLNRAGLLSLLIRG